MRDSAPATAAAVTPPTLDGIYDDIRPGLEQVEDRLRTWSESDNPLVAEIGGYVLMGRGKRVRPALVLLASRLSGPGDPGEEVLLAALVEIIHTASLIHDDIVDKTRRRRGRDSAHARWGVNVTVLLGDYLYIRSIGQSLGARDTRVIRILTDASARMIEGELAEIAAGGGTALSEAAYLDILAKKTAALFEACCRLGAVCGGAPADREEALADYGRDLGMCFQLVDDLLDFSGDPRVLGKPTLSDLREGRLTLPLIRALARDGKDLGPRLDGLLRRRTIPPAERREILEIVRSRDGLAGTFETARAYAERARARLAAFPPSPVRAALDRLADYALRRDR